MARSRLKRFVFLAWAMALAFGITFQSGVAEASHSSCLSLCNANCGGACSSYEAVGCSCFWECSDGSEGSSICTI